MVEGPITMEGVVVFSMGSGGLETEYWVEGMKGRESEIE